jgi:hypothetical protein
VLFRVYLSRIRYVDDLKMGDWGWVHEQIEPCWLVGRLDGYQRE